MLGFAPIASVPVSALPADDGSIFVQLTGQVATAQSGQLQPQLQGFTATASSGALTPVVAVTLTGQSCTATQGYMQPDPFRQLMTGQSATASTGTLTPEVGVVLTGQVGTTQTTSVGYINATSTSVVVSLLLAGKNIFAGTLGPNVIAGTTAVTATATPSAATDFQNSGGGPTEFEARQSQPVYYQGYYLSFGESYDGSGDDWATLLHKGFAGRSVTESPNWFELVESPSLGSIPDDLNPKLSGNSTQLFPNTGTVYSDAPRKYGHGGQVGIDEDGNLALLRSRYYDYSGYTYPYRKQFYAYQGTIGGYFYRGPEVVRDNLDASYQQSGAGAEDGPFSNSMGVVVLPAGEYRHEQVGSSSYDFNRQNALVFYPSYWNDNGSENWVPTYQKVTQIGLDVGELVGSPVQLTSFTGVDRLYAMQNSLTVTYSGYANVAYITYLSSTPLAPRTPAYVGLIVINLDTLVVSSHELQPLATAASTFTPTKDFYEAYKYLAKPKSDVVKLSSGRSVTQFLQRQFVINLTWSATDYLNPVLTPKPGPVSSGSSNYLALGSESLEVKGDTVLHTLWHVGANSSWTSSSRTFTFRPYTNDATSTDVTWTLPGADLWSWTLNWGSSVTHYPEFHVGSKPGYRTWLYQNELQDDLSQTHLRAAESFISFWSGQAPILGTAASSRVGLIDTTIIEGTVVALTGHQLQTQRGQFGSTTGPITVALTGLQATANFTNPIASSGSVTVALTGFTALAQYEPLGASNGITEVILTGQVATTARGDVYPPGAWPLTGQVATTQQGSLGLEPTRVRLASNLLHADFGVFQFAGTFQALTGQVATTARGTLTPVVSVVLSGQSATAVAGTLAPSITVALTGQSCTASGGTITTPIIADCTGQQATASSGSLGVVLTIPLTGTALAASYGSFGIVVDATVALTGQACTTASGTLTSEVAVRCTGSTLTSSKGALGLVIAPSLSGHSTTMVEGTLVVAISRLLPGELVTMAYGTMPLIVDNNPNVTGVYTTGYVGETTVPHLPVPGDSNLWAIQEIEKLFNTTSVDEGFVAMSPRDLT